MGKLARSACTGGIIGQSRDQIPTLFFSEPAKSTWIKHFNEIESALAALGEFASITDFASKAAENAARLAALFHLFEGKTGDINCEDIERAIQIIRWHLSETKRVLKTTHASEEFQDAIKLISWITAKEYKIQRHNIYNNTARLEIKNVAMRQLKF